MLLFSVLRCVLKQRVSNHSWKNVFIVHLNFSANKMSAIISTSKPLKRSNLVDMCRLSGGFPAEKTCSSGMMTLWPWKKYKICQWCRWRTKANQLWIYHKVGFSENLPDHVFKKRRHKLEKMAMDLEDLGMWERVFTWDDDRLGLEK